MRSHATRTTVDLSAYPDLVVIYLGMRVNGLTGWWTLLRFGRRIARAVAEQPDGLLLHEPLLFSLRHVGMRQYWRDFDALERWSRTLPHQAWWQRFVRDTSGTGFWHESYSIRGGMESVYLDMEKPVGFQRFATVVPARGSLFTARRRLRLEAPETTAAPIHEHELYGDEPG